MYDILAGRSKGFGACRPQLDEVWILSSSNLHFAFLALLLKDTGKEESGFRGS